MTLSTGPLFFDQPVAGAGPLAERTGSLSSISHSPEKKDLISQSTLAPYVLIFIYAADDLGGNRGGLEVRGGGTGQEAIVMSRGAEKNTLRAPVLPFALI